MQGSTSTRALASLLAWASAQAIAIDERQQEQLEFYLNNLLLWNRRVSLVSQSDPSCITEKHFADALIAARFCHGAASVVDIGSGAGFPGIIIAIRNPESRVTLVESRQRKASFLLDTARAARIENVEIVAERADMFASSRADKYAVSIARALGSVEVLLEHSRSLLRDEGLAVAMKGPSYQKEVEETPIERLGFRGPTVHSYSLPDRSHRVLLGFALVEGPVECFT
jgi:16S rRNA (guanine527-N7)-methyltransferase